MECPHYEYDEIFQEHICHAGNETCLKEYVNTCKYQPPEECNNDEEYYGEFGLY